MLIAGVFMMAGVVMPMGMDHRLATRRVMQPRTTSAQHACGNRAPNGKQNCQQNDEPDANGLHFFMLSQGVVRRPDEAFLQ
ncbi:MAG: hypothetical protein JWQ33_3164 [Ramlibacter sp.]|nr:hypothetical protein [Ramlibacter sp.]